MNDFGSKLRELREKRGLTINQLSMYSGVSSALISKIENGKRGVPKPETLEKLAVPLKLKYEELMIIAGHTPASSATNEDQERTHSLPDSEIEKFITQKEIEYGVIIHNDPIFRASLRNLIETIAQTKLDQQKKNNP